MAVPPELHRWLLTGADPSVRLRVLRELDGRPDDDRAVQRARLEVGRTGWAARMLQEQHPSGAWDTARTTDRDLYVPKYIATNWRLIVLAELGVPGTHPRIARALRLFLDRMGGPSGGFGGRGSEVCFTGNAARMLIRFGRLREPALASSLAWLVRAQKRDGGWHCFRSRTGTLDGWEALAAFAALPPSSRSPEVDRAIERGAEFYLRHRLLNEGPRPYAPWRRLHFPAHYYYDVLVGLDLLTTLGYARDRRLGPALELLEEKRDPQGRWGAEALHPDTEDPRYPGPSPAYPISIEAPGRPSRWITTTALLVLRRAGRI